MKNKYTEIEFLGKEWILIGGAITTKELWIKDRYNDSYAHLYPDGTIKRYGQVIGTKEDITYINGGSVPVTK